MSLNFNIIKLSTSLDYISAVLLRFKNFLWKHTQGEQDTYVITKEDDTDDPSRLV